MKSEASKIVVRVDGSTKLGMGHVMRCLRLAVHLHTHIEPSPEILFITSEPGEQMEIIQKAGFPLIQPSETIEEDFDMEVLPDFLNELEPDMLILDVNWCEIPEALDGIPDSTRVMSLHEHNFPVLENVSSINPSIVNQPLPADGARGETHFQGPDYLLIDEKIPAMAGSRVEVPSEPGRVVVCLGGADPEGWTLRVAHVLSGMENIQTVVLLGNAFPDLYLREIKMLDGIEFHIGSPDAVKFLAGADLVIVNGATTMFEALALGLPSIAIPRNPYEAIQVDTCSRFGSVLRMESSQIEIELSEMVNLALVDSNLRKELASGGRTLIDGKGIERVGSIITRMLER